MDNTGKPDVDTNRFVLLWFTGHLYRLRVPSVYYLCINTNDYFHDCFAVHKHGQPDPDAGFYY
jgi:hypothetical protein